MLTGLTDNLGVVNVVSAGTARGADGCSLAVRCEYDDGNHAVGALLVVDEVRVHLDKPPPQIRAFVGRGKFGLDSKRVAVHLRDSAGMSLQLRHQDGSVSLPA